MAAAPIVVKTLEFSNLTQIVLSDGDSDKRRQWGGKSWRALKGTPVLDLQRALIAVGLLKKADGEFGPGTKIALSRYQWYRRNIRVCLKLPSSGVPPITGLVVGCAPFFSSSTPGTCNHGVACDLLSWKQSNFVTTTPLVRVGTKALSNVEISDEFIPLDYPSSQPGEVVLHADFAHVVGALNDEAKKDNVTIKINQAFRRANVAPTGAVVHPAKKSQHLIGHAIDLNIFDDETKNSAPMFKNGKETKRADAFVNGMKSKGYRWGGDFSDTDPVHFDSLLDPSGEDYNMTYFFAQHCFQGQHPMRLTA